MTHLFSVFHDFKFSGVTINKDLELLSDWAFQWEMSVNLDPSEQA